MSHVSIKFTASVIGSLALALTAACEQRTDSQITPTTTTPAQEPNALNPTPRTSPAGMGGASARSLPIENPDTVPVRGTDTEVQGGGAGGGGGHAGHGGNAGHGGHAGKSPH